LSDIPKSVNAAILSEDNYALPANYRHFCVAASTATLVLFFAYCGSIYRSLVNAQLYALLHDVTQLNISTTFTDALHRAYKNPSNREKNKNSAFKNFENNSKATA